eukprot:1195351-Prorocentrum_minimum.AAC.5
MENYFDSLWETFLYKGCALLLMASCLFDRGLARVPRLCCIGQLSYLPNTLCNILWDEIQLHGRGDSRVEGAVTVEATTGRIARAMRGGDHEGRFPIRGTAGLSISIYLRGWV